MTLAAALTFVLAAPALAGPPLVSTKTVCSAPTMAALSSLHAGKDGWARFVPRSVTVVGGVTLPQGDLGPGGGGSAYADIRPLGGRWGAGLGLQPGFGLWYQRTDFISKESYKGDIQGLVITDRFRDEKTVKTKVYDLGKATYGVRLGRFTPYVGAGFALAKRQESWKSTENLVVTYEGETMMDETFLLDQGRTASTTAQPYFNAGLSARLGRRLSASADYAQMPLLGPRLGLGLTYTLDAKR